MLRKGPLEYDEITKRLMIANREIKSKPYNHRAYIYKGWPFTYCKLEIHALIFFVSLKKKIYHTT